jgi:hypothetical protein
MNLLTDLMGRGLEIVGWVAHVKFCAEMAELGDFTVAAVVKYDRLVREKAAIEGVSAVTGADPILVSRCFNASGTRQRPNRASSTTRTDRKPVSRLRKSAMEKKLCFKFTEGVSCDGGNCGFRHACVYCNALDHGGKRCPDSRRN